MKQLFRYHSARVSFLTVGLCLLSLFALQAFPKQPVTAVQQITSTTQGSSIQKAHFDSAKGYKASASKQNQASEITDNESLEDPAKEDTTPLEVLHWNKNDRTISAWSRISVHVESNSVLNRLKTVVMLL